MKYENILVGADPELFLYDVKLQEFVSVEGYLGGTKEKPKKIGNEGFAVQEDNVMAEFCIPPAKNENDFVGSIIFMKEWLSEHLKTKDPDIRLLAVPSAEFDFMHLSTPQSTTFGCEPDFNVWTGEQNTVPENASSNNLRVAGGHIHIGYDNSNEELSERLIKCMDIIFGVSSVIIDKDVRRKTLYGKAGAFRFKSYGVEYRTPSNFWLENEELIRLAYKLTRRAVDLANDSKFDPDEYVFVREIINDNHTEAALKIISRFRLTEVEDFVSNRVLAKV